MPAAYNTGFSNLRFATRTSFFLLLIFAITNEFPR